MNKTGKKIKYINSNNYLKEATEENFSYDTFLSEIPDPIRYFSKNYWTLHEDNLIYANKNNKNVMFDVEQIGDSTILLKANKDKFTRDIINENGILERIFDSDKWRLFLNNILPTSNKLFEDYIFQIDDPVDIKDKIDFSEKNIKYIKKESKYNFYSEAYELLTGDRVFNITTLPYIFSILNNPQLDIRTKEENLVLTLGGLISDNYAESLFLEKSYSEIVKEYFNIYSDIYRNTDSRAVIENLSNYSKKIKISGERIRALNNLSFVPFPYHIDIKFSNLSNREDNFINKLNKFKNAKSDLEDYLYNDIGVSKQKKFISDSDIVEEVTINEYDIKDWINKGSSGDLKSEFNTIPVIEYTKLANMIKKELKTLSRKYDELNKTANISDVLFYKIEKRQGSYNSSNVLQTFWVTPDMSDLIRLIDTQIKYGTNYYYTISAYIMTVGNTYSYEKYDYSGEYAKILEQSDFADGLYRINIKNSSSYKIFQVAYAKILTSVGENPRTKPIINIQKNDDNIRINMLSSEENSYEDIKIIENRDFTLLESIKVSQNNPDKEQIYCTNDTNENNILQIYKSTIKPINYLSFQGKLYKTLKLGIDRTFTDKIISNIKYYYTFRYLNNHDVPSQVSKVYEVIMKNEDGYSYLETNEIDLESGPEPTLFKPFKKYLLLRPTMMQVQPQLDRKINSVNDIILGPDGNSVWNKNFTIRITSKKTNRIMEFNVKPIINRKKE